MKPNVDYHKKWDDPPNLPHFRKLVPLFLNPELQGPPIHDTQGLGLNHFAGNSQVFDRPKSTQLADGNSNTLMIGEVQSEFVPWGSPHNSRAPLRGLGKSDGFGSATSRTNRFDMLDGSTRVLSNKLDPRVLAALSDPNSTSD